MPKQGASCPDTALPEGYVRTFLPFTLCLYMCLSPTPLAGCPSASRLRAVVWFFFPPCVRSGGVEVCVRACVDAFPHYLTPVQCICCNKLKPHAKILDVRCTQDPRRGRTVDNAINLILLLSYICFTAVWPDLFSDTPLLSLWGLSSTFVCKDRIMKSSDEMLLNTL